MAETYFYNVYKKCEGRLTPALKDHGDVLHLSEIHEDQESDVHWFEFVTLERFAAEEFETVNYSYHFQPGESDVVICKHLAWSTERQTMDFEKIANSLAAE